LLLLLSVAADVGWLLILSLQLLSSQMPSLSPQVPLQATIDRIAFNPNVFLVVLLHRSHQLT
jgi:hypothetical protein